MSDPVVPPRITRRLQLKRFAVRNINAQWYGAFRLRVEAHQAENMDPNVFMYRRDPANPYTSDATDTFFTVASPVDMAEFPPGQPNPGNAVPFFRKSWVELDFRSTEQAMQAWQLILKEVSTLIDAMNRLDELQMVEAVWVGPFPPDPFHGSASVSEPIP